MMLTDARDLLMQGQSLNHPGIAGAKVAIGSANTNPPVRETLWNNFVLLGPDSTAWTPYQPTGMDMFRNDWTQA